MKKLQFEHHFRSLGEDFYSDVSPDPLPDASLVIKNQSLLKNLDLNLTDKDLQQLCSGNYEGINAMPLAMVYSGHQFGGYTPRLGDGRGQLLGELNVDDKLWDFHIKGAGKTPYSRFGDGRAVLRSSIREYLGSIAMQGLGIPTTNALALVSSSLPVQREQVEQGAALLRVTPCHIRFGNFEYFYYTSQFAEVRKLADYCIARYYPEVTKAQNPYLEFYKSVLNATAKMVADWQAVGFAHGVMNTDNFSIIGETFDYGPFVFLDDYDRHYICNHSDDQGRYRFDRQPMIAHWNCGCLGQTLVELVPVDDLQAAVQSFQDIYEKYFYTNIANKLGFKTASNEVIEIWERLEALLQSLSIDYTSFFYQLTNTQSEQSFDSAVREITDTPPRELMHELLTWRSDWLSMVRGIKSDFEYTKALMKKSNPRFILRNYLAQEAIEQAKVGDYSKVLELADYLEDPFSPAIPEDYCQPAPAWGKGIVLSCSS